MTILKVISTAVTILFFDSMSILQATINFIEVELTECALLTTAVCTSQHKEIYLSKYRRYDTIRQYYLALLLDRCLNFI